MSDNTDIEGEAAVVAAGDTVQDPAQDPAEQVLEPDQHAEALAEIAGVIEAQGLAPEGDYDIAVVACALIAEVPDLRQQLANAEHALGVAQKAQASPSGAKGRKVGPIKDDPLAALGEGRSAALLEQMRAAELIEVAFSNGKSEIPGLAAVRIEGDAWAATVVGVQLRLPELIVHGPGVGRSSWTLHGYGLLLDGKLAAYAQRGDPLEVVPGARMNLAPDICF